MKNRKTSSRSITVQISFSNPKYQVVFCQSKTVNSFPVRLIVQCGFNLTLISHTYQLKLKLVHKSVEKIPTIQYSERYELSGLGLGLMIWWFYSRWLCCIKGFLLRKVYVEVFHEKEVLLAFYFDLLKTSSVLLGIHHWNHSISDCLWILGGLYSSSDAEIIFRKLWIV